MKTQIVIFLLFVSINTSFGQEKWPDSAKSTTKPLSDDAIFSDKNIPAYFIPLERTTTIVSPEPILYVDISTNRVEGDLSAATGNKVFRLKPSKDFIEDETFTVSIVTEKMVALYKLTCRRSDNHNDNIYTIAINPQTAWRLNEYNKPSPADFERLSFYALTKRRAIYNIKTKENGMEGWINNIYTAGEYILIDVGIKNNTHLPFDVEEVRFKLLDKYEVSAHVSQELEMPAVFQLYNKDNASIKKTWRNFYIFPKFTYPDNKVFQIEISEHPISGRKLTINIDYNQMLHADILQ